MPVGALEGITVVECCTFVTGPYATALLADLGARVIKIESPPDGDPYRYFAPDPFFSPHFAHLNRGKHSLALDLKSPRGKEICLKLVERADVFVENFRPGVAERLGLGYESLRALNQKLIYCSISAFGQSGPYANNPGFDTLGQAMSGLLSVLTDMDKPKLMGIALSDYVTGLSAGYGILGALFARQKSQQGCRVETSLLRSTLAFIGEAAATYLRTGETPDRVARVKNAHAFAFPAKDKLPLVIHCSVPEKFWIALLKTIDRLDLAEDSRFKSRDARRENFAALEAELAPAFTQRTRQEWLKLLAENDVPAGPLYDMAGVLADPQVRHEGLIEEVEHPKAGKLQLVASGVRYEGLAYTAAKPPPLVGEQSAQILAELGYDADEVRKLRQQGVVG